MLSQGLDTVSSVECVADLFISLHKSLQFSVKLDILTGKNIAMVLEGFNFSSIVSVGLSHRGGCKSEIILFASSDTEVIISAASFSFNIIQVGGQALVTLNFSFGTSDQLRLFLHLQVQCSG